MIYDNSADGCRSSGYLSASTSPPPSRPLSTSANPANGGSAPVSAAAAASTALSPGSSPTTSLATAHSSPAASSAPIPSAASRQHAKNKYNDYGCSRSNPVPPIIGSHQPAPHPSSHQPASSPVSLAAAAAAAAALAAASSPSPYYHYPYSAPPPLSYQNHYSQQHQQHLLHTHGGHSNLGSFRASPVPFGAPPPPHSSQSFAAAAHSAQSLPGADEYWPTTSVLTSPLAESPRLVHTWRCPNSVLSLVTTRDWIIAGCGDGHILIFSKEDFVTVAVLPGHRPSAKAESSSSTNPQSQQSRDQSNECDEKDYSGSSVYSLAVTPDERFLFSGGADSLVKVWDLVTLEEIYTIYSIHDIGDVFSVAWIPKHEVLVLGSQNASIQWIQLYDKSSYNVTQDPSGLPSLRFDRFFDSKGPGGKMAPQQHAKTILVAESDAKRRQTSEDFDASPDAGTLTLLEIPPKNVIQYAHFGYVYTLLVVNRKLSHQTTSVSSSVSDESDEFLVSGGGDGAVKFWAFQKERGTFQQVYSLDTESSVFSMTYYDNFLYLGLTDGQVGLYDMDTNQVVRVDKVADEGDVMTMSLYGDCLFRGGSSSATNGLPTGVVRKWDSKRYVRAEWIAHHGIVLATVITDFSLARKVLVTGGNDSTVSMWDITSMLDQQVLASAVNTSNVLLSQQFSDQLSISPGGAFSSQYQPPVSQPASAAIQQKQVATLTTDHMLRTLRDFVAYKTVSGHDGMYANDCRRCAIFLRSLMRHFGADAHLIPVEDGNPIVVGIFRGGNNKDKKREGSVSAASSSPISAFNAHRRSTGGAPAESPLSGATSESSATAFSEQDQGAAQTTQEKPCRILFYGHYDVIIADKLSDQWDTDPFNMTALDGYLYGRGVSDDKGPVLAAIFAVAELVQRSELENDIVFVIEGEEECGSRGFQQAIRSARDLIAGTDNTATRGSPQADPAAAPENDEDTVAGNSASATVESEGNGGIDWVLLSNSYWLDDKTPCLNYGLRGIIKATVEIKSSFPDLHSGVHGGVFREPTIDLVNLLSKLSTDQGHILLPAFHDSVRPVDDVERRLYADILSKPELIDGLISETCPEVTASNDSDSSSLAENSIKQLMSRWRYPSLTIHRINVSGPGNSTLIPARASASISLRIVPDQDISVIKASLLSYLSGEFAKFGSCNELDVDIFHEAEPWVGDPSNRAFCVLENALETEWGQPPIYIREGGSIPAVRFLEKEFCAPAAQLPCGQASDGAHMNNERLRVMNFLKTRNVLQRTFKELR